MWWGQGLCFCNCLINFHHSQFSITIELFYLNPLVPYLFAITDGDDLNEDGINNDNSMIFISGRYIPEINYSFFWEFILDDYQYNKTTTQDMLAWKLGFEGQSDLLNYLVTESE